MKIADSQKVVLPTEGVSGRATTSAFAQIMNLLINVLAKLGLLKEDLDYHVVRASMVIIYFFFGYQKCDCELRGEGIDSFYQQRPSYFLDVPRFRHPGGQLVFRGFRNGYLACSCSWDSGTKS